MTFLLPQHPLSRAAVTSVVGAVVAVGVGVVIAKGGIVVAGLLVGGPPALVFAAVCFQRPRVGLFATLLLSFFLFSHSIGQMIVDATGISVGLILDGCLLMALLGVLLTGSRDDLARLNQPLTYMIGFWLLYTIFELVNPEVRSREPWFFAVRGLSLYWFQVVIIAPVCLNERRDVDRFVSIWLWCSVVSALWSFKQQYLGLTADEQHWLDTVGKPTHLIRGFLRSFSFCSDAGQFGAVMAHATTFTMVRMLDEPVFRKKVLYAVLTAAFFWGFAVAGSRGPLVIIGAGFAVYLILKRNIVVLVAGGTAGALAYGILKFTAIGQGNYQVQRIRSALDPDDPSFQRRLYNQSLFKTYMATRPFGVGLGLAGDSGKKYGKSVVTEKGIDSWYVKIWVETGEVGLWIHGASLLIIAILGMRKVFRIRDPTLRSVMSGLLCGYVGLLVASYGNQIFGQSPTCFIVYLSMVFFLNSDRYDPL